MMKGKKVPETKKKVFIEAYKLTFGNVSLSCKHAKMGRDTFYRWMKSDAAFKKKIDAIEPDNDLLDLCEGVLIKKIREGDGQCLLHVLKTKGRSRGYGEKTVLEGEITTEMRITRRIITGPEGK